MGFVLIEPSISISKLGTKKMDYPCAKKFNIKIIFDSTAINPKFKTGWGFSCLINNHILFDTGADGTALLNNFHLMNVNLSDISKVIISHEHSDHFGGLWKLLEKQKNISDPFVFLRLFFTEPSNLNRNDR